jgi:ELP3 family radical SAM enzyme/protein acetyltransferase
MPDLYEEYDLLNKDIQADQWKIYPTMTTRWTQIKEWYDEGSYKPYAEENNGEKLLNLLMDVKQKVFPWIRLNRVIRDIPSNEVYGGHKKGNLRQDIHTIFKQQGLVCKCIRCREVKCNKVDLSKAILCVRKYEANNGTEYFISYESPDNQYLYAFIRLRINHCQKDIFFKELEGCSLVRELHVYGQLIEHSGIHQNGKTQHYGFGKKLLEYAEYLSKKNKFNKIAVISGIGVREYYKKRGYYKDNTYMIKKI